MSSRIFKDGAFSKLNRRNIAVTILAGILVGAIVFLPELISISTSTGTDDDAALLTSQDSARLDTSNENYFLEIGSNVLPLKEGSIKDGAQGAAELDVALHHPRPRLSRDQHRGNISRGINESLLLAKRLGVDASATKYALFDFVNSLRIILDGTKNILSGVEAYDFVTETRTRVVEAFRADKIGRELTRTWNAVSISALEGVDFLKCDIANEKTEKKEEPALAIPADPTLKRKIRPMKISFPQIARGADGRSLWLVGVVHTHEFLDRIEVLKRGQTYGCAYLQEEYPEGRSFYWRTHDATGELTIRSVFTNGDYFDSVVKLWDGVTGKYKGGGTSPGVTLTAGDANEPVFKEL